ncbi:Phosphatidic acid phosphatase (PAP2) family protein [Arabidopsis thaliana]|uniref:Lipid phosphate phosphatase epsilon 2, chloroplastic n=2 Tax=Arabidopsis thaliana TaxID=3702 RepID=LPPE2_ARATH|nr:Phosphatidic acid phosphatase (PAP2) family protein [Arabidopsis thaliana]NP_201446.2 Phosphatidic acid phosphatase (PAP2) family protein [Arabidopsis thaliana]Q6NQL6.1 RecName: Full=Lipid phosphate phosphatase epsilon 2, chloroplastic; Short=AtLPPE2; AltName: Full=Phosphatidic acid phosphatase epsilon 2; AltName: Full=Plastidic phosphatidic acid phosphatase epsilon 2; Flags: Precursor [Arabidopsis thaliana]AAQ62437.1 At5g66450 [Arabidopsis thaliana]AED98215.1 Phosphatidic acid phosphatase (|eukprot:NP_001331934.1 Phosphatidic acid phosphatase (PAP2) family protein [Arabidopsis thaliana]
MAASSSSLLLLHKPTYNFHFAASSVPTYINSARFRISSSIFPLDRRRRRRIWSVSGFKSMADLVKTNARRDGEDRFQALEQEAFISNSSSELQNELVSDAGDGIEAIANRLSKWIVAALFGSVLLLRHDGAALWAVIGSVSNSVLSVALKRILNQERPVATLRSDPGMPSSHAQSISFISVFSVFSVMEWLGTNVLSLFLSGFILALGSYFTWLRVSQKLHTTSQVVVGAIVGSVYSTLWYVTWNSLVLEAFTSTFSVQIALFLVAAASALGFAVYVLLNWFKDDR